MTWSIQSDYGHFHQWGTVHIPARRFIGIGDNVHREIVRAMRDFEAKLEKRAAVKSVENFASRRK